MSLKEVAAPPRSAQLPVTWGFGVEASLTSSVRFQRCVLLEIFRPLTMFFLQTYILNSRNNGRLPVTALTLLSSSSAAGFDDTQQQAVTK